MDVEGLDDARSDVACLDVAGVGGERAGDALSDFPYFNFVLAVAMFARFFGAQFIDSCIGAYLINI